MTRHDQTASTAPTNFADLDHPLLLRGEGLARLLSISLRTLWRKDSAGLLPRAVNLSGCKRWRRAEILAWIEAGCPDRCTWEASRTAHRSPGGTNTSRPSSARHRAAESGDR